MNADETSEHAGDLDHVGMAHAERFAAEPEGTTLRKFWHLHETANGAKNPFPKWARFSKPAE
ncbi:hypothetical protein ABQJ48_19350 [Paraburkholderia sp. DGU8]